MGRMRTRRYKTGKEMGLSTTRVPALVYFDREVLDSIDDLADVMDRSRSDLMREAASRLLAVYTRAARQQAKKA